MSTEWDHRGLVGGSPIRPWKQIDAPVELQLQKIDGRGRRGATFRKRIDASVDLQTNQSVARVAAEILDGTGGSCWVCGRYIHKQFLFALRLRLSDVISHQVTIEQHQRYFVGWGGWECHWSVQLPGIHPCGGICHSAVVRGLLGQVVQVRGDSV